jgi:hypothetical protein
MKEKPKKDYKQNFSQAWAKKFEWVTNVNNKAYCNICSKTIMGDSFHLKRHEETPSHIKKLEAVKNTPNIRFFSK